MSPDKTSLSARKTTLSHTTTTLLYAATTLSGPTASLSCRKTTGFRSAASRSPTSPKCHLPET